ncbi:flotillin family protein [Anaerospora hongkongensis]|uniref:flotillin family protein n=1 Tax=Anaerospora hongkongensis TaxID=244830 RepID=UPI002FDB16ED
MELFDNLLTTGLFAAVGFLVLAFAISAFGKTAANLYVKVRPNEAAVFYGRKHKPKDGEEKGYQIITGGAKLRIPILEDVMFLNLNTFPVDIDVIDVPNKDGVKVSVRGNANMKIKRDIASLEAAAERFLGYPDESIHEIAHKSLEGHLRAIVGKMTIEDLVKDRTALKQNVLEEAGDDFAKMGMYIDFLTINDITDKDKYIDSLGQKRTAEVQKDAVLGRAEAVRDTKIGEAEAEREATIRSTTANQVAATRAAENEAMVALAEKERDVKKAEYLAQTQRESAFAALAGPLATAEKEKEVVAAQKEVDRIRTIKETAIAEAEAEKREKQLIAEVVKPAEAAKQAQIIQADGDLQAEIKKAEARKRQLELEAEGEASKILSIGQAKAKAIQLEKEAEAAGVAALAESYKKMDEVGRTIQMIEKIGEVGPALVTSFAGVVDAAARPLGNVEKITITDFGGTGTPITGLAKVAPQVIAQMMEGFKGVGINPAQLLQKMKLESIDTVSPHGNEAGRLQPKERQDEEKSNVTATDI